jgi:hypothetical protein
MSVEIIEKEIEFNLDQEEYNITQAKITKLNKEIEMLLSLLVSGKIKRKVKVIKETHFDYITEFYNGKVLSKITNPNSEKETILSQPSKVVEEAIDLGLPPEEIDPSYEEDIFSE